jgi:hypothetical protein
MVKDKCRGALDKILGRLGQKIKVKSNKIKTPSPEYLFWGEETRPVSAGAVGRFVFI